MPITRSLTPIIAAVCAIFFVVGAGMSILVWSLNRPVVAVAPVDSDKQRQLEEDPALVAQRKKLDDDRGELARKSQFDRFMIAGNAAMAKKQYNEAENDYQQAVQLFPDDQLAQRSLQDARIALGAASRIGQDDEKRQAEYNRLMALGKEKMAARQYALAVNTFEAVLLVMVGDSTAAQALLQAKEALAQDESEKTKLAKYKNHMEAGRLAMAARRYEDAIKEYRSALLVMPGDSAATNARQAAEDQLKGTGDARYVLQQLDRAQAALDARRFKEAVGTLEALVKEVPDNDDASRMLRDAKKTLARAQADCDRFVKLATLALQARRYEEALLNFREAVKALPEDKDASNGLAQVEKLMTDSQASQLAYERFMRLGRIAMLNKQYADALASFQEALRIAPNDILAQNGYRDALKAVKRSADRQKEFDRLVGVINNALKNRQWVIAIQASNSAMGLNPDDTRVPAALKSAQYGKDMDDGQVALRANRYADAIRLFQDALVQKPGDAAATSLLGLAKGMSK